tara:strand:- start:9662 stop:10246 length:585 start_codon:yes stop_codon:yes gene_type:complete
MSLFNKKIWTSIESDLDLSGSLLNINNDITIRSTKSENRTITTNFLVLKDDFVEHINSNRTLIKEYLNNKNYDGNKHILNFDKKLLELKDISCNNNVGDWEELDVSYNTIDNICSWNSDTTDHVYLKNICLPFRIVNGDGFSEEIWKTKLIKTTDCPQSTYGYSISHTPNFGHGNHMIILDRFNNYIRLKDAYS